MPYTHSKCIKEKGNETPWFYQLEQLAISILLQFFLQNGFVCWIVRVCAVCGGVCAGMCVYACA